MEAVNSRTRLLDCLAVLLSIVLLSPFALDRRRLPTIPAGRSAWWLAAGDSNTATYAHD
jgi:hypothetical protein